MNAAANHFRNKLEFETDAWDLSEMLREGKDVVIVDARSAAAYSGGHLPGAINLPHRSMSQKTTNHLSREALFVTYCDGIGCNASTKGALRMAELGFRVKELIGGLEWWKRDGYAVETSVDALVQSQVM
jgi:rhodanese-related sulfurtransferase